MLVLLSYVLGPTPMDLMFWPGATAPWTVYATSLVFSVVILALGFGVFRRLEGPVLKEI